MTFNEEQLKILSAWEDNFRTAVNAQWARNPGSIALRIIFDTYTYATGDTRRFSDNCSDCILHLLRDCGKVYFKDKEELATRKKAKKVEVSEAEAAPVKKVKVKVTKKAKTDAV